MENKIFGLTSDGWFTFYVCRFCGKRIQLEIDETPLPEDALIVMQKIQLMRRMRKSYENERRCAVQTCKSD